MDRKTSVKLLLLWTGLFFSATTLATPTQSADVASLINQRLSHMKDVAGYKAQHHLAIEDLPQEAKVLANSAAEAEKLGLDGESVKPFIQAQMDAAKAIQYRYRADWLSSPETGWQPAPLEQVRVKIGALSTAILTGINQTLTQDRQFTDHAAFMKKALAAELAKGLKTEADLNAFSRMLTKLTVETALNAELTDHLGHEKMPLKQVEYPQRLFV